MAQEGQKISIIAAIGKNTRALGKDNQLIWRLPDDMKRFKELTAGHPVIMGRKTWESIPEKFRPLPNRTNIVVTRFTDQEVPGVILVNNFPEALSRAKEAEGSEEIFIIGGHRIYEAGLPFASCLYLTLVESDTEGDVFFPKYEEEFSKVLSEESGSSNGISYTWVTLTRP